MPEKKKSAKKTTVKKSANNAEISAEQVVKEEVFPDKNGAKRKNCRCDKSDKPVEHARKGKGKCDRNETAAEHVIEHSSCKCGCTRNPSEPRKNAAAHKRAGAAPAKTSPTKGERPKQKGYKMIDPSDGSADGSKS